MYDWHQFKKALLPCIQIHKILTVNHGSDFSWELAELPDPNKMKCAHLGYLRSHH